MAARFWAKVQKTDGCWLWQAGRNKSGYGLFYVGSPIRIGAHRAAWELEHGSVPDGMVVMHLCDTKPCVRPGHLVLGGQSANIADAFRKGLIPKYNAAKTHCPRGHAYSETNTYVWRGRRTCRECARDRRREWAAQRQSRHNAAKTECKNGHPFSPENTYLWKGHRYCRICRKNSWRAWAARS